MIIYELIGKPGVGKSTTINELEKIPEILIVTPIKFSNFWSRIYGIMKGICFCVVSLLPLRFWPILIRRIASVECKMKWFERFMLTSTRKCVVLCDEGPLRVLRDTKYVSLKEQRIYQKYNNNQWEKLLGSGLKFHAIILEMEESLRINRINARSVARSQMIKNKSLFDKVKNKITKYIVRVEVSHGYRDHVYYEKLLYQYPERFSESTIFVREHDSPSDVALKVLNKIKVKV